MTTDDILDSGFTESETNSILDIITWWEKKRGVFNFILIGVELIMILIFWTGTLRFGIEYAFLWSIAYTVAANIFFSIGWGISILGYYYGLKFLQNLSEYRMLFFVVGVIFSIYITVGLYRDALSYSHGTYFFNLF